MKYFFYVFYIQQKDKSKEARIIYVVTYVYVLCFCLVALFWIAMIFIFFPQI